MAIMFSVFAVLLVLQTTVYGQKLGNKAPPVYSTTLETQLRDELFTNYSVLQRPSENVLVTLSLTVFTINELDIKDQILSVSGYLSMKWSDSRLRWLSLTTDYSSIRFMFSSEAYCWRPLVIIENSVEDMSIIGHSYIPMRIFSTGHIDWNPMGIYKVHCESDITYYPLDQQSCDIKVTTWGYTSREVVLLFGATPIDMEFYSENGEWEIVETSGTKSSEKSRGGQSFSSLTFNLKLRRRLIFHVLNTLFPVGMMAFLIPFVFKLHVESGEKIGYSLTVLLAYAVYLSLISENIPSTSVAVCYLSVYLAILFGLGTLSVFCTILVINVNQLPDHKKIPNWIHRYANFNLFSACTCCTGRKCCFCFRKDEETPVKSIHLNDFTGNEDIRKTKKDILSEYNKKVLDPTEESSELTWKDVAKMLDQFFFYSFTTFIVTAMIVLCIVIFTHYLST